MKQLFREAGWKMFRRYLTSRREGLINRLLSLSTHKEPDQMDQIVGELRLIDEILNEDKLEAVVLKAVKE